jgi:ATPase family associated with various cellular activities (AAA)
MLPDFEPEPDGEIVADNIRAVQAIYFARQLEDMRVFQVVDRLAQLFQQGLLPLGPGKGGRLLKDYATVADRLSAQARNELYVRALGVPPGAASIAQPNREFRTLWLDLVTNVALFSRQPSALVPGKPIVAEAVWRAARALASNASAHGAGLIAAVQRLSADANALRAVLQTPGIQQAFGARDMWQVIDRVASRELGGAVNVKRFRALAQAGSSILQWLADHADALNKPAPLVTGPPPRVEELIDAVESWLASSSAPHGETDIDSEPTGVAAVAASRVDLWALADELMRITGLQGVLSRLDGMNASQDPTHLHGLVTLFCGAAGTGKTLGAHALAATAARDLVRVDLGQIVSKYIGETEKNLDAILSRAERTGALLLFDEADALFGRRTTVQDAHDRNSNVDVDALMRRLQAHQGVVIFESHVMPTQADEDWKARFNQVVRFPRPPQG